MAVKTVLLGCDDMGGSMDLRNIGILPQYYTSSQSIWTRLDVNFFLAIFPGTHPSLLLGEKYSSAVQLIIRFKMYPKGPTYMASKIPYFLALFSCCSDVTRMEFGSVSNGNWPRYFLRPVVLASSRQDVPVHKKCSQNAVTQLLSNLSCNPEQRSIRIFENSHSLWRVWCYFLNLYFFLVWETWLAKKLNMSLSVSLALSHILAF
jgi:hypothetical protein